jgi:holin-like protein
MIRGLVILLAFQSLGELVAKGLSLPIPGPVAGLVFLLCFLLVRKRIDQDLGAVSAAFSQHLGLLFVPAAVGVVIFIPQLAEHALAIGFALLGSVALAIGVTAILLAFFGRKPRD